MDGDQHGKEGTEGTRYFLKLKEAVQAAEPAHYTKNHHQPAEQSVEALPLCPFRCRPGPRQEPEAVALPPVDGVAWIGHDSGWWSGRVHLVL